MSHKIRKLLALSILQITLFFWLFYWGVWALLLPFNKYEGEEGLEGVLDCRGNSTSFIFLSIWVIWITTFSILGISIFNEFWSSAKSLWFINTLALIVSFACILRYGELVQYTQVLQQVCNW